YVGANGEMGYLEPDSTGSLIYVSLLHHLSVKDQEFARVRHICTVDARVYFCSPEALFRWDGQRFKVWKSEAGHPFLNLFQYRNIPYLFIYGKGLTRMVNNRLIPTDLTDFFHEEQINLMLSYDENRSLIGTYDHGLFLYDGHRVVPFHTEIDKILSERKLLRGVVLSDSTFALGTQYGGLYILDKSGNRKIFIEEQGQQGIRQIRD